MKKFFRQLSYRYWFRIALTVCSCLLTAWFGFQKDSIGFGISVILLILSILWQIRLYRRHVKQVLFMIDALENNDNSFRFPEEDGTAESRQINIALNRVCQHRTVSTQ